MSVRFWRLFRRFLGCFTVTVFTTDDEAVRPEGDVVWTWAGLRYLTVVELWDATIKNATLSPNTVDGRTA